MLAERAATLRGATVGDAPVASSARPGGRQPRRRAAHQPAIIDAGAGGGTSALLASLIHELRTPVSALATGSELLLADLDQLSRDDLQRIVETMHRGAIWLQRLVENVLYAATVAEGAARIYPRAVNLVDLVRDVAPVMQPLLRQRGQTLRVVNRLDGAQVSADSRRIGQVLINLIANACKYSGPSTRIEVVAARRQDRVRVHVADRGPGLPPGEAERLFSAYTRDPEMGLAGVDGAGLGLAIVKSIISLHGGSVGAARRRGGGSVFWFELPVATAEPVTSTEVPGMVRRRLA